jgi:hypothetical protein
LYIKKETTLKLKLLVGNLKAQYLDEAALQAIN